MRRLLKGALAALFLLAVAAGAAWAQTPGYPGFVTFYYQNITGQTTTVLRAGPGSLHTITFNTPVATEVVTIWDNTSAAGTKIGTITVPASPQPVTLVYDVSFGKGLTVQTATASSDITVSFR
jgi:hypothetical protein